MTSLKNIIVDTTDTLNDCLTAISPQQESPIHIAVDIEGVYLGRAGKVCIIQLFARGGDTVWLIDVTTLEDVAFDYDDGQGRSLRGIFESPTIRKYFYEVRNDSDALYNLHRVSLAGVYDLQLLELATRSSESRPKRFLNGLKKSIDSYLPHPSQEYKRVKEAGLALFAPEMGGRYEVFDERPLDPRLITYCAQDVALLFELEDVLQRRMGARQVAKLEGKIIAESAGRVRLAFSPSFNGKGQHMALAPTGW